MIGRRDYETRKAARIERLQDRAERLRTEGNARIDGARRIGDMIPMGQPILVGHHSEKRHRRDIARIDSGYRKGFEALKNAEHCERRASTAESNRTISSDDPEAITKLREKLEGIEKSRAQGVSLNKAQRAKDPIAALAALGIKDPARILQLAKEALLDHRIVPGYSLRNMASECTRIKARIALLEKRAAAPEVPPETIGEVRIVEEDNRVLVHFPGKPSEAIRTALKSRGFRWAPTVGAWSRMASTGAHYDAREIARKVAASAA